MNKNILILLVSSLLFSIFTSCENMEDTYKEFVGDGETVYIGKADSIKARGGRNRLELSWLLLSDPKVSSFKVYWNNKGDSIEGDLVKTENVDTVRLMMDPIKEGIHQFEIYLFDKVGHSSVRTSIIGTVYGEDYEKSLLNRTFTSAKRDDQNVIIEWVPAAEEVVGVDIEYIDTSDELVKKQVLGTVDVDTLFNFPSEGSFSIKTVFLPDSLAIDQFSSPVETIKLSI